MLIPAVPLKRLNALLLLVAYPVLAFILLTGGDFDIGTIFGNLFSVFRIRSGPLSPTGSC